MMLCSPIAADGCRAAPSFPVQALASLDKAQEELHRAAASPSAAALDAAPAKGGGTPGVDPGAPDSVPVAESRGSGDGNGRSAENGGTPGPSRGLMLADVEVAWRKWKLTSACGGVLPGGDSGSQGGEEALLDTLVKYFIRYAPPLPLWDPTRDA